MRLGWSLTQIEADMDAHELSRWATFDSIEPIGDERLDILSARTGVIAAGGKLDGGVVPKWDGWIEQADEKLAQAREEVDTIRLKHFYMKLGERAGAKQQPCLPNDSYRQ